TSDTVKCLICGRSFVYLQPHLRFAHGISDREYREAYSIPSGEPLAGEAYRQMHAEKLRRLQEEGRITYDHLPRATEASRHAPKRCKTPQDAEAQANRIRQVKPWAKRQLPPGAKRADGRDADRAREYQRAYRLRRKM